MGELGIYEGIREKYEEICLLVGTEKFPSMQPTDSHPLPENKLLILENSRNIMK